MTASKTWQRLKQIGRGLNDQAFRAWPFWFAVGIPAVAAAMLLLVLPPSTDWLRCYGVTLQVLGLIVVMYGLNALRKELRGDGQGFGAAITRWFRGFVRILRPAMTGSLQAQETGSDQVDMQGTVSAGRPKTGDARLDDLETKVAEIQKKLTDLDLAAVTKNSELSHQIADALQAQRKFEWNIRSAHLRGLAPELIAVIWIICGLVLASLPSGKLLDGNAVTADDHAWLDRTTLSAKPCPTITL